MSRLAPSRIPLAGLAMTTLALAAGCGDGSGDAPTTATDGPSPAATTAPTAACATAMEAMRLAYDAAADGADTNALELGPLTACGSVDDWLLAAADNPGALGLTELADITAEFDIAPRCSVLVATARATPVCQDAVARGLIE